MTTLGADLVLAAAKGDEAAFTALVVRHHRDLLRVAYVICRDPALAEDAAQAAWAIAWRRLGDVKDPAQVRSWLVAVAANEARRALASLDPTDRALIALRYVAELSSDDIGRALGMSPSGARGLLSRLLVRLRGELRDE